MRGLMNDYLLYPKIFFDLIVAVSSPQMGLLKLIIVAHKVDNLSMKINIK